MLNIYHVIFWEGDGAPDTVYEVTAATHLDAAQMAEMHRRDLLLQDMFSDQTQADAVSLIGESRLGEEPQVLLYGVRHMGYTHGTTWHYDRQEQQWQTHEEYFRETEGPGYLCVTLYVDVFYTSPEQMRALVTEAVEGTMKGAGISCPWGKLGVSRNPDHHLQKKQVDGPDAFLHFLYLLEIEPMEGVDKVTYVEHIRQLVRWLRGKEMRVVVSYFGEGFGEWPEEQSQTE